jgi:hypothetical protein
MRRGIGLRGYAQQDPLNEFRREAFQLYGELRDLIRHQVATTIFRVTVTRQPPPGEADLVRNLAAGAAGSRPARRRPASRPRPVRPGLAPRPPSGRRPDPSPSARSSRAGSPRTRWRPRARPAATAPAEQARAGSGRGSPRRAPGSVATTRAGASRA